MAYTKTVWTDRQVQYPSRYDLTNVTGDTYDLSRNEGTVTDVGTLVSAAVMNNIENGIETNSISIGTLASLTTTEKTNLVGAINEVDGGITKLQNVTKYLTATATTNGDYKVNITNTLTTNDIYYIYFPSATTNTQNARLSIDDGTTYKNIKWFDTDNALGSDVELKYKVLRYDGTNFILLDNVRSGSNANGNWVKYCDGTMTCDIKKSVTNAFDQPVGIMYRPDPYYIGITYPIAFIARPTLTSDIISDYNLFNNLAASSNEATTVALPLSPSKIASATTFIIDIKACGRWRV